MNATRKLSAVQEAYVKAQPARDHLRKIGARCMETTEDKCGILWERWLVTRAAEHDGEGKIVRMGMCGNIYLYATPHGWDLSLPAELNNSAKATLDTVTEFAKSI